MDVWGRNADRDTYTLGNWRVDRTIGGNLSSNQSYLKATDLLEAHHIERTRPGAAPPAIVSVIVGPVDRARATFVGWAEGRQLAHLVPPSNDLDLIRLLLNARPLNTAVLFVPAASNLKNDLEVARQLACLDRQRPVGFAVDPLQAQRLLLSSDFKATEEVRRTFIGGFIPTDPELVKPFEETIEQTEVELYRSDHENILHKLMRLTPEIGEIFKVNSRLRPFAFGTSFEIDFWCEELAFALEVDGLQHASETQRKRDLKRDQTLAQKGIKTLRIHASSVITSPTETVRTVAAAVAARRKELGK